METAQTGGVIIVVAVVIIVGDGGGASLHGDLIIGDGRFGLAGIIRLGVQQISVLIVFVNDGVGLQFCRSAFGLFGGGCAVLRIGGCGVDVVIIGE